MKTATLKKAKPENVVRLAKWLKLDIDGMSHRHIVKLVKWRITRHKKREMGLIINWF